MSLRQNAFALLVVTALLGIVGEWALPPGTPQLWRVPLGLLLAGLAYELWTARRAGLSLAVQAPPRWRLGRPVAVALEVSQQRARPLTVELALEPPTGADGDRSVRRLEVRGDAPARIEFATVARRLGRLRWPAQRLRIGGPLGLAWWPRTLEPGAAVTVVPDLQTTTLAVAGALSVGARASGRAGAGAEVMQLRDFRSGDSIRAIDWKATARRGQLVSRDFAEDQHLDIVVALDAGRSSGIWCDDLDRLGHYVNVAARFAEHAVAHDDQVGLVVFGDRALAALPPARGVAAVSRIRALLGAVEVQTTDSNPIHAAARIRALVHRRCLVVLLTDIDAASSGSQLVSAVRLLQPQHLPFVVGLRSAALEHFGRDPARDWLAPYRALAAEEHRLRERRSLAALAGGGVLALVVRPAELERAVFDSYARLRRRHLV
jgi:uncharacterized protein (DUF58 family)